MMRGEIFIALGQSLFAVFGACVKWLNMKDKTQQKLASLLREAVSASFAGLLVYCVYSWQELNVFVAFALAGIVGNQGAKGINFVGRLIMKNSGLKMPESATTEGRGQEERGK